MTVRNVVSRLLIFTTRHCHANILADSRNTPQHKPGKCIFVCHRWIVVLSLTPHNRTFYVVILAFFLTLCVFGFSFRTQSSLFQIIYISRERERFSFFKACDLLLLFLFTKEAVIYIAPTELHQKIEDKFCSFLTLPFMHYRFLRVRVITVLVDWV